MTAYEAVAGKPFSGKTCLFGEAVMGFVGVENKQKGTAKWMPLILFRKTPNDMYILSRGTN